jgi:hypothetical protein
MKRHQIDSLTTTPPLKKIQRTKDQMSLTHEAITQQSTINDALITIQRYVRLYLAKKKLIKELFKDSWSLLDTDEGKINVCVLSWRSRV